MLYYKLREINLQIMSCNC